MYCAFFPTDLVAAMKPARRSPGADLPDRRDPSLFGPGGFRISSPISMTMTNGGSLRSTTPIRLFDSTNRVSKC